MTTEYCVREVGPSRYEVAKFTDHKRPDEVYLVLEGRCTCPGSVRSNNPCTHLKLVTTLVENEIPFVGMFWDKDTDIITRPIPLNEPLNILSALHNDPVVEARSDVPARRSSSKSSKIRRKNVGG